MGVQAPHDPRRQTAGARYLDPTRRPADHGGRETPRMGDPRAGSLPRHLYAASARDGHGGIAGRVLGALFTTDGLDDLSMRQRLYVDAQGVGAQDGYNPGRPPRAPRRTGVADHGVDPRRPHDPAEPGLLGVRPAGRPGDRRTGRGPRRPEDPGRRLRVHHAAGRPALRGGRLDRFAGPGNRRRGGEHRFPQHPDPDLRTDARRHPQQPAGGIRDR